MSQPRQAGSRPGCDHCGSWLDFDVAMAFQPIVDVDMQTVWGHEALVRGLGGEGAGEVLARVAGATRSVLDQRCRIRAVEIAADLELPGILSVNFLPNLMHEPSRCLGVTLDAAKRVGLPLDRIMIEVTEGDQASDQDNLKHVLATCREHGLRTAIDDFGAGYAGLNLLADFQPDVIKIDMHLVQGIVVHQSRRALVRAVLGACKELGVDVIAEGVETADEMQVLLDLGVTLMQGYLFAKPALVSQATVHWPRVA